MLFCRAFNWKRRLTKKDLQVFVEPKTIYLSILLTKFNVLGNITKFFNNTIRIFPTGSDHIIQFIPRFWFLLPTLVFESFTTVCITDLTKGSDFFRASFFVGEWDKQKLARA